MNWCIGEVELRNPLVLAPMAGVTDVAFRPLVRARGAALTFGEMVSAVALTRGNPRTLAMVEIEAGERPVGLQLFGSDPDIMAEGAMILAEHGADLIDINAGCPVARVTGAGEGAALMQDPRLVGRIVGKLAAAVRVPVTIKMRSGWDRASINAPEVAARAEAAGAQAVTIHGRSRAQLYSGCADWEVIARVKAAIGIPVIGNGDVRTPADAARMLAETGCDAVMIGRAAQGNPWIFSRALHFLYTGVEPPEPDPRERIEAALLHLDRLCRYKGEYIGVREMRRHAAWYIKGLPFAAGYRQGLNRISQQKEFAHTLRNYLMNLADYGPGGQEPCDG